MKVQAPVEVKEAENIAAGDIFIAPSDGGTTVPVYAICVSFQNDNFGSLLLTGPQAGTVVQRPLRAVVFNQDCSVRPTGSPTEWSTDTRPSLGQVKLAFNASGAYFVAVDGSSIFTVDVSNGYLDEKLRGLHYATGWEIVWHAGSQSTVVATS